MTLIASCALASARRVHRCRFATALKYSSVNWSGHCTSNEHLPRYSACGPDLGWACAVRDRLKYSLRAFSEYVEGEPTWREVRAIRTETALPTRLGTSQIKRVFKRYGFELVPSASSPLARLHGLGECFVLWGLTRAFNPAALPRQPFLRDRHELWISRAALRLRYAQRNRQIGIEAAQRREA